MNSASRNFTVCNRQDSLSDHVSAFRIALDLFGAADLSEFVPPREHPSYLEILGELVRMELAHHRQLGKPASLETYRVRFPDLFANPVMTHQITQEEFNLRQQTGENSIRCAIRPSSESSPSLEAAPIWPLDPAVSSKFDIMLAPEASHNYPVTARLLQNHTPSPGPGAEVGQTRLGLPADRGLLQSSDPEIVWTSTEVMGQMPNAGDEFLGFSLLAELGKGAFGKVFLAQQGQLAGRLVALKIATGLFSESQTLAQLQHTHIVPIYSYHHGQPFQAVCMPYLGSTTLAHVLADLRTHKSMPSSGKELLSTLNDRRKSTRRFEDSSKNGTANPVHDPEGAEREEVAAVSPAKPHARVLELEGMSYVDSILWLAVRLADGLAHAHEQGIIHRDLKPANILLSDDGVPMLLDFNLADDNKVRGIGPAAIGGTLPYMAPEHLEAFRGNAMEVDARSDLYSFGVILFELLTGAAPFPSHRKLSTRETVNRMIHDRRRVAPRLRPLNKSIPPAVEAIVRRCLEACPDRRYQTARQLQEDLQRQLEHKPLKHAANPSLWERCQKFRKRHPRLTSVTSVAAAFCLLIAGLASAFAVREDHYARVEAKQTLSRFQLDAETAQVLLVCMSKDRVEEGRRFCRSTLDHFQVLENPDWRKAPAVQHLSKEDRRALEEEVRKLLVLLAHAQQFAGKCESNPTRQKELFLEGLQICSLATNCFGDEDSPAAALWRLQGNLHRKLNDQDKAQQCFERAAKHTEFKSVQSRYLTAWLLADEGKFREALPLLDEGIRLKPQDFHLHFLQGICYTHLGHHAKAISCYRTCISLRPTFYEVYFNRGLSYLRQGDYQSAVADFDQVVRLKPDRVETYSQRAMALQQLGKYAEAIADLTEGLDRGDTQTRLYFLRAKVRAQAGDPDGAKKDFAEGLLREPKDENSWIARGIAYLPAEPKKALSDFDEALKINPSSLAALQNKAHVLSKYLKLTEEAVKVLDTAVQFYPDDIRPLGGRGTLLARLGKRAAAIKDAELALQIDTYNPANLYVLAGIYALTSRQVPDDRREALHFLSAALKRGYGFQHLEDDRDLDPIRGSATFRQLIEGSRALNAAAQKKRD